LRTPFPQRNIPKKQSTIYQQSIFDNHICVTLWPVFEITNQSIFIHQI